MESKASASLAAEVALFFLESTFVLGFACALVQNCWQPDSELVQLHVNPSFLCSSQSGFQFIIHGAGSNNLKN